MPLCPWSQNLACMQPWGRVLPPSTGWRLAADVGPRAKVNLTFVMSGQPMVKEITELCKLEI